MCRGKEYSNQLETWAVLPPAGWGGPWAGWRGNTCQTTAGRTVCAAGCGGSARMAARHRWCVGKFSPPYVEPHNWGRCTCHIRRWCSRSGYCQWCTRRSGRASRVFPFRACSVWWKEECVRKRRLLFVYCHKRLEKREVHLEVITFRYIVNDWSIKQLFQLSNMHWHHAFCLLYFYHFDRWLIWQFLNESVICSLKCQKAAKSRHFSPSWLSKGWGMPSCLLFLSDQKSKTQRHSAHCGIRQRNSAGSALFNLISCWKNFLSDQSIINWQML